LDSSSPSRASVPRRQRDHPQRKQAGNGPLFTISPFIVINSGETISLDVLANDSADDGETISIIRVGESAIGATIEIDLSGSIQYTPVAGRYGDDADSCTISAGNGRCEPPQGVAQLGQRSRHHAR